MSFRLLDIGKYDKSTVTRDALVKFLKGKFGINLKVNKVKDKNEVKATIRPDDIKIVKEDLENTVDGVIEVRTFLGKAYQYDIKTKLGNLIVNSENDGIYEKGQNIKLQLPVDKIVIL